MAQERLGDHFPRRVRIPKEHPKIPMTTHKRNLRGRETMFKKPANSFVPQIVEMKVLNSGLRLHPFPGQPKRIPRDRKHPVVCPRDAPQHIDRLSTQRECPRVTILRLGDQEGSLLDIEIIPFYRHNLTPSHPRLNSDKDDRDDEGVLP